MKKKSADQRWVKMLLNLIQMEMYGYILEKKDGTFEHIHPDHSEAKKILMERLMK